MIEVNNEAGVPVDEPGLGRLARFVLDELGVSALAELSVLLVDSAAMTALHEQWMDLPGPTDVMAFPMDALPDDLPRPGEPPGRPDASGAGGPTQVLLGDVVLCPDVAAEQARTAGHSTAAELQLLLTHGVLHLLGHDHAEPDDEQTMFDLQTKLLTDWVGQTGGEPIRTPRPGTDGVVRQ